MGLWNLFLSILTEIRVFIRIFLIPISGKNHKDRLESFYARQKEGYDSFRKRLLHGRTELLQSIPEIKNAVWIDMGGGTGWNVEEMDRLGKLDQFSKVYIVDLSPSLLSIARKRVLEKEWKNVEVVEADATSWRPDEAGRIDLITFSYSLTMIPDWFLAIEHAQRLLKPQAGILGLVDFYVPRKWPGEGLKSQSWLFRTFWQLWFAFDNVYLNQDHIPYLLSHFKKITLLERLGPVPYVPIVKSPHYVFVGTNSSKWIL